MVLLLLLLPPPSPPLQLLPLPSDCCCGGWLGSEDEVEDEEELELLLLFQRERMCNTAHTNVKVGPPVARKCTDTHKKAEREANKHTRTRGRDRIKKTRGSEVEMDGVCMCACAPVHAWRACGCMRTESFERRGSCGVGLCEADVCDADADVVLCERVLDERCNEGELEPVLQHQHACKQQHNTINHNQHTDNAHTTHRQRMWHRQQRTQHSDGRNTSTTGTRHAQGQDP